MSKKEGAVMKIWENRKKIIEGLKNTLIRNETVEKIAAERQKICMNCPDGKRDIVGTHCLVPGTQPCCAECGCSEKLKLRSLSSACDLGHWPVVLTSDEVTELGLDDE